MSRLGWRQLERFLFPPESNSWLAVLRVGLGVEVLLYTISGRLDWAELFGSGGRALVNREIAEGMLSLESAAVPRVGWLITLGHALGIGESYVIWSIWAALVCAGCFLIVGLFSRSSAITAWLLHLCAVKSEDLLSYGMDNFTTIGLFYLMLSPLPDRWSLDAWLRKRSSRYSDFNGFFRRMLQVHVCFIYFLSGLTKFMGAEWWNGKSLWRALTLPPYNLLAPEWVVHWRYFLPLAGILIAALETVYPFLIWPKRSRRIVLTCIIAMHVGIGLTMGLYLFSLIMIILDLAAFGPASTAWADDDVDLERSGRSALGEAGGRSEVGNGARQDALAV